MATNPNSMVQEAVDAAISKRGEIGLQVVAYVDGKQVVDVWGGLADITTGRQVDADTVFPVFSVTKAVTAVALHIQAERGLVDYAMPIAHYWPEFGAHGKDDAKCHDLCRHPWKASGAAAMVETPGCGVRHGLYSESAVRALAVHPSDARIMYCGADSGVYRSEDSGEHWDRLDSPMNEIPIWALAIDPIDPNIIFAGTRPAALFRSTDGGQHWDKLSVQIAEECPNVGIPRVTALVVDPVDHQHIWAGLEVDGVRHSRDGGKTWEVVTSGVTDPDIHNLAITVGPPKTLLTITPREIFSSTDNGATWEPVQVRSQVVHPVLPGRAR